MNFFKKILVTGSLGYIGTVLTKYLQNLGHDAVGYDVGFFKDCTIDSEKDQNVIYKNIKEIQLEDLKDVCTVVHLADISNDPFGNLTPEKVYDPARQYTFRLATLCKELGIKFIFASSCSVYGKGKSDSFLNEESEVYPQTPYSVNKLQIEQDLASISDNTFQPICLRFATVFGFSSRIRFDVFVNMMVGMALSSGRIILNSDGKAWRPSVHIKDVCKAIEFAIRHDNQLQKPLILNVGKTTENHQILEIAQMITKKISGCEIVYMKEIKKVEDSRYMELIKDRKLQDHVDSRTYKISFENILNVFPGFMCDYTVEDGISSLVDELKKINLTENIFKNINYYRLQKMNYLFENGYINEYFCLTKKAKYE